jgi:outer membrane lipoprotein carrier protein
MVKSKPPKTTTVNVGIKDKRPHKARCLLPAVHCLLPAAYCLLLFCSAAYATDAETALASMQQRYASVATVAGFFRLSSKIPGFEQQVESGEFWLKKPGKMRWDYRHPQGQIFVADGKKTYFFVPQDNQVTVQSFTAEELQSTPLKFLLGSGDYRESFVIAPESEFIMESDGTQIIRLMPKNEAEYSFLVLEIDKESSDLRRLTIEEPNGNTLEYLFTGLKTDVKVNDDKFLFEMPEGVEVLQIENEE